MFVETMPAVVTILTVCAFVFYAMTEKPKYPAFIFSVTLTAGLFAGMMITVDAPLAGKHGDYVAVVGAIGASFFAVTTTLRFAQSGQSGKVTFFSVVGLVADVIAIVSAMRGK